MSKATLYIADEVVSVILGYHTEVGAPWDSPSPFNSIVQ